MDAQKGTATPLKGLRESELLRKMAEVEDELEKSSNESSKIQHEIASIECNVSRINDYIKILSNSQYFRGLSWKERVALLNKEKKDEFEVLKELDKKLLETNVKIQRFQQELDVMVSQEQCLYETQFPNAGKTQGNPYYI